MEDKEDSPGHVHVDRDNGNSQEMRSHRVTQTLLFVAVLEM